MALDQVKKRYGLLGYPLGHSFSPAYFKQKFEKEGLLDYQYDLFEAQNLGEWIDWAKADGTIRGFNVTIPYKQSILNYLDEIDAHSRAIGAVNTVKIDNGCFIGFNTDVLGFKSCIDGLEGLPERGRVLVLGKGGGAAAVAYVWHDRGWAVDLLSGQEIRSMSESRNIDIADYQVIVNATPIGMYPHIHEKPPLAYAQLSSKHFVIDLIYNPEKTLFLALAEQQGARIQNGKKMLYAQAEASWKIWTGKMSEYK